jgi:hypothetical protein
MTEKFPLMPSTVEAQIFQSSAMGLATTNRHVCRGSSKSSARHTLGHSNRFIQQLREGMPTPIAYGIYDLCRRR